MPSAASSLAAVAQVPDASVPELLTRLERALRRLPDGRLEWVTLRTHWDKAEQARAQRRAAGRSSGQARAGPKTNGRSTAVERAFNERSTSVRIAPSGEARTREERSERTRSCALLNQIQIESALGAQAGDVIARIGTDDGRNAAKQQLAKWRRDKARQLIHDFIKDLREKKLTTAPLSKADELAAGQWSVPARVDAIVARATDLLAVGQCPNPFGYLLSCLGLGPAGKARMIEIPLVLSAKWDQEEACFLGSFERIAVLQGVIDEKRRGRAMENQA
jgi:hypothetical protein